MIRPDEYFVLFTCGLSVVMALGLIIRPHNLRNVVLALALLFLGYLQFVSIMITTHLIYKLPHLMFTQIPFGYSISPLIFLYVKSFTHNKRAIQKWDFLLFLPALFFLIAMVQHLLSPVEEKLAAVDSIYTGFSLFRLLISISITAFFIFTIILLFKIKRVFHKENPVHKKLALVFLLFFSWIILVIVKIIGIVLSIDYLWRVVNFIFALETIGLYLMLQKMPFLLSFGKMSVVKPVEDKRQILDSVDTNQLQSELELMMEGEKLYCDEDLTLGRCAHALEISPHQLSAFLNSHYGKNFNSFINSYRIEYALSLLKDDPEASTLSVAFASGFNSYSAFFSAFKRETGKSPAAFKSDKTKNI